MAAWYSLRRVSSNLRVFRATAVFAPGMRHMVTGMLLAAAGIALPYVQGEISETGLVVSPEYVALVLRPLQPFLQDIVPVLDADTDIDTIIDNQIRQQGGDPATLSSGERQRIHQQVSDQFKVTVTGRESLSEVVAGRINDTLRRVTQANALIISLVAVVVAFLTIRAVIPILSRILLVGVLAAIWLGCRVGLLSVRKEMVEAEVLTF
jgi:hypothetical protein